MRKPGCFSIVSVIFMLAAGILFTTCVTTDPNQASNDIEKAMIIYSKNLSVRSAMPESIKDDKELAKFFEKYFNYADNLNERIYVKLNRSIYKALAIVQKNNDYSYDHGDITKESVDIFKDMPGIVRSTGSFIRYSISIGANMLKLTYQEEKYSDEFSKKYNETKSAEIENFKNRVDSAIIYFACPVDDDFENSCNMEFIPELLENEELVVKYFENYCETIFDIKVLLYQANKKQALAVINGYSVDRSMILEEMKKQAAADQPTVNPQLPRKFKQIVRKLIKINKHQKNNKTKIEELFGSWSEEKKNEFNGVSECYEKKLEGIFNGWLNESLKEPGLHHQRLSIFYSSSKMGEYFQGLE